MGVAENERAEFHDADESREVKDFSVGVAAVQNTREVEELRALVDFSPETLFERFLGILEYGRLFDEVKVGEDSDDFRETMSLEDIEELKRFLVSKSSVLIIVREAYYSPSRTHTTRLSSKARGLQLSQRRSWS